MRTEPCLSDPHVVASLPIREHPHWNILEYCRHLGVARNAQKPTFWVARIRLKSGGYRQVKIAPVKQFHEDGIEHQEALAAARHWFAKPEIEALASVPFPRGPNRKLIYDKEVAGFTIGDALRDFIEWKRVAASPTYFDSTLSLVNHHIVPRLGDVLVDDFTSRMFTAFCIEVLESPPKHGRQKTGKRIQLRQLDHERLRKRKKTLNTLIGILRNTLRMAWENGETNSDRAWRLLKRVPHADVPRHIFLTRKQAKHLISVCRDDLAKLVTGALYTGCRVSELAQLKVRDVGGHFFGIYVAPLKSYRGRYVCLPDEGMTFFLDQCGQKDEEDFVFKMASGKNWTGCHKHLFKAAVRKAGLPDSFVFHGLRHTYASQLVQAGTPLAIVAKQLGHSNTDSVSRTYGHLSCQSIEDELARRFAPLNRKRRDPRLRKLKGTLQAQEAPQPSWPQKNYSKAGGEILSALRDNHRFNEQAERRRVRN